MVRFSDSSIQILTVGPQIARVLRILRVSRLLRLSKGSKGLQSLLQTMEYSIPQIVTIVGLLMLFYFITACLAYALFKDVTFGGQIDDEIVNFELLQIADNALPVLNR